MKSGYEKREKIGLREGMNSFLSVLTSDEIKETSKLHRAWEIVAPPILLEHTDSVRYSNKGNQKGVLIFLDDSVWVAECDMSRDSYRILLEKSMDQEIDEIHFYLTKDKRFKTTFHKRNNGGYLVNLGGESEEERPYFLGDGAKGEVSSRDKMRIERKCGFIEDEALRESVSKAMKSNIEWKMGQETAKRR